MTAPILLALAGTDCVLASVSSHRFSKGTRAPNSGLGIATPLREWAATPRTAGTHRIDVLDKLARLIENERDALLTDWRTQVRALPAARGLDVPTLNDHFPDFLTELATALQTGSDQTIPQALLEGTGLAHGLQRVKDAFDVEEVVAEYNILRGCIHDLAERNGLSMRERPFHVLNRVLDVAIGSAVQSFAARKAIEVRQRREELTKWWGRAGLNLFAAGKRTLASDGNGFDSGNSTRHFL